MTNAGGTPNGPPAEGEQATRMSAIEIQGAEKAVRVEATDDGAKVTTERFAGC